MIVTEDMLTTAQKESIKHSVRNNLLVQGVAGSGKSQVIIKRALWFCKKAKEGGRKAKIAIFTFANSLVNYSNEVIQQEGDGNENTILVKTLDSEILWLYKKFTKRNVQKPYAKYKDELKTVVDELRKNKYGDIRFLSKEKYEFLLDEIAWMKQHLFKDFVQYKECKRKGRGAVRVSKNEREVIFDVYKMYYERLAQQNKYTMDMICEEIINKYTIPEGDKYDFLLVDEAQDLSLSKLMIARRLTRLSMTISADFAQKIYKTGFTWKEVGIKINGQSSKKLQGTHRNTKQIAMLANSLMEHNTEIKRNDAEDYTVPVLPEVEGAKPKLVYVSSYNQEQDDLVSVVKEYLKYKPNATIGIFGRTRTETGKIIKWLSTARIPYQKIDKESQYKILTPGVKVVTYHSAKGLEFNYVFMPLLDKGIIPFVKDVDLSDENAVEDCLNSERSLMYVGITRARDMLFMFACDGADGRPSPLLDDLDKELLDIVK